MRRHLWILLGLAVGAGFVACSAMTPPIKTGDLGNAKFTYVCGGKTDPQCNVDAELAPKAKDLEFPSMAVGSVFGLKANKADIEVGPTELAVEPIGDSVLKQDFQTKLFTVVRGGFASVLAKDGPITYDLTSIALVVPNHIKLLQAASDGKFLASVAVEPGGVTATVQVVKTYRFRAIAVDAKETFLSGALPCLWTTSDAGIAKLASAADENIVTVTTGTTSGTATVTVKLGTMTSDIKITVN